MNTFLKLILALALSFLCWIVCLTVFIAISSFMGFGTERYASLFVVCWLSTTVSALIAKEVSKRFIPHYGEKKFIGIYAVIVLLWVASSFLGGIEVDFKAISFIGHSLALFIAYRTSEARQVVTADADEPLTDFNLEIELNKLK